MSVELDAGAFCREIEAHLCRRNDGHLVRIVGPAFDLVCGWARAGVPLKVAFRGIDRTVERHRARGPRRRPLRIEFCEADVLDAFDEWRRAVGPMLLARSEEGAGAGASASPAAGAEVEGGMRGHRPPALTTHLDRVLLRLTSLVAGSPLPSALRALLERIIGELDALRAQAGRLRGETRAAALARLAALDAEVLACAVATADAAALGAARRDAEEELAGYRGRLAPGAFDAAVEAAARRALHDHLRLPRLAIE